MVFLRRSSLFHNRNQLHQTAPGKSQLSPLAIRKNSVNRLPLTLYFQALWSSPMRPRDRDVLLAVQVPFRRGWSIALTLATALHYACSEQYEQFASSCCSSLHPVARSHLGWDAPAPSEAGSSAPGC